MAEQDHTELKDRPRLSACNPVASAGNETLRPSDSDKLNRLSIIVGFMRALGDVLTTAQNHEDFVTNMSDTTIRDLQWLQLELAEQAEELIDG